MLSGCGSTVHLSAMSPARTTLQGEALLKTEGTSSTTDFLCRKQKTRARSLTGQELLLHSWLISLRKPSDHSDRTAVREGQDGSQFLASDTIGHSSNPLEGMVCRPCVLCCPLVD